MKKKSFLIIGLGRFGSSMALTLTDAGHDVLGIDVAKDKVEHIANHITNALITDATNEDNLKALGVSNFDVAVVAIGHDMQASILTTVILKELGAKYIVAKAQNELHGKVLEKTGADRVIYPERDMGIRVANSLTTSNILDYIELSEEYNIYDIKASDKMIGKSLGKLNLRAKYGVNVLAIKKGKNIQVSPGADFVIEEDNILVVLADEKNMITFNKVFG